MNPILYITSTILVLFIFLIISQIIYFFFANEIKNFCMKLFTKSTQKNNEILKVITFINSLSSVLCKMSANKVGALIVIENNDNLARFVNVGNKITSPFSAELVLSVFYNKKSPLHDGAMIIRDLNIISVSSYLPMTKRSINIKYGARHRASFGITERTDCFAFVVSETSGDITFSHRDHHRVLSSNPETLAIEIAKIFDYFNAYQRYYKKGERANLTHELEKYNNPQEVNSKIAL